MNLPNGHLLQNGKYRLTHVVGQGGFGITYKGVWFTEVKGELGTINTEVPVCVKEYFFKDYCFREAGSFAVKVHSETGRTLFEKFKEKLIKEAKILSELHHPYIVNVLEVFEENNTAYIVMEYISANSLKSMMEKEGVLPEAKVLKYVHQIGTALQFVHDKNILHLDIKPSNILIDKNDDARLIDFGVSKRYDIEQQETSTTMLTLSKGFASIEQYDNEGILVFSPCPDIYSLGATMYNLLTGKVPTESILRATRPLQKPSALNSAISAKTEKAILKAMSIVPADRFRSIGEMLSALDLPPFEAEHGSKSLNKVPDSYLPTPEGGETTVVCPPSTLGPKEEDDDQTIVNQPTSKPLSVEGEKEGKGKWLATLLVLCVIIGSAFALWVHNNKRETPPAEKTIVAEEVDQQRPDQLTDRIENIVDKPMAEATSLPESELPGEQPKAETPKKEEKKEAAKEKTKQKPIDADKRREITKQPERAKTRVESSVLDVEARYASLLTSGQIQMDAGNYQEAKKLLTDAKQVKLTEEVVRFLITCDAKIEEKRIADRKALYEEKMDFGRYKIVRKKSSGKYGAIDANGEERIPCKYLSVGKAENGRAFERLDNLFDIYKADGTLAIEGATYY